MSEIPAKEMIETIIEVFGITKEPPKGIKKSVITLPRAQLMQLRTFVLKRVYEGALELETRREDGEMTPDGQSSD